MEQFLEWVSVIDDAFWNIPSLLIGSFIFALCMYCVYIGLSI